MSLEDMPTPVRSIRTQAGTQSLSTGKSTGPHTHGRGAVRPVPSPIREGRMPRGRCYASSSNTGWKPRIIRAHGPRQCFPKHRDEAFSSAASNLIPSRRLLVSVFLGVRFPGLLGVVSGMVGVPTRSVRVVGRFLVLTAVVMFRRLLVMASRMRMML
jgi:hypothetical protein